MPVWIMHCLSVESFVVCHRTLSARWETAVISLSIIEMMIDVTIEVSWSVEPGTSSDKDTASKPLRPVITIRSAVIWRLFVIPIRTRRRNSDTHRNLRVRLVSWSSQHTNGRYRQRKILQRLHIFTSWCESCSFGLENLFRTAIVSGAA